MQGMEAVRGRPQGDPVQTHATPWAARKRGPAAGGEYYLTGHIEILR